MDGEQEEAVQRITARYVAELRAGQHPRLSDYLTRYPQYADAITGFVAYYHATEVDIPEGIAMVAPLSQASRAALDEAWKRILHPERTADKSLTTLHMAANNLGKSLSQLAVEIGLSIDILEMLERRVIDTATIPKEVYKRLAKALQQPLATIETYLGCAERKQLVQGISEEAASYHVEVQSKVQKQSFRELVEQSIQLSNEQKDSWRSILIKDGL
jgi:transcriptional regulator with XRE-family HTH domain